jgi:hypothetical protein
MCALSSARETDRKPGDLIAYGVAANGKPYKGGLVMLNASGYAIAGANTTACLSLGVAYESIDNTGGANGAKSVRVWRTGIHPFAIAAAAVTDIGKLVYISDDLTVTLTAGHVLAGRIAEVYSSTSVGVEIDMTSLQQAHIADAAGGDAGSGTDHVTLTTLNAALASHLAVINAILVRLEVASIVKSA